MAEYLSPGVFVETADSGIKPIEGVRTGTAGFIGMTQRGRVTGVPESVESYGEFQLKFGGYLPKEVYKERRYLPMAVEQFFVNGGTRCYAVRLLCEETAATASKTIAGIAFTASSPGAWGNDVTVAVSASPIGKDFCNFQVSCLDAKGEPVQQETFQDVSLDAASDNYIGKAFEKSLLVNVEYPSDSTENEIDHLSKQEEEELPEIVDDTCPEESPEIVDDTHPKDDEIKPEKRSILAAFISFLLQLIGLGTKDNPVRSKAAEGVRLDNAPVPAENMADPLPKQEEPDTDNTHNPQPIAPRRTADDLLVEFLNANPNGDPVIRLEGGFDHKDKANIPEIVNAALLKGKDGGPGKRSGLAAFGDVSEVAVVVAPGVTDQSEIAEIVSHCELMKNGVCILDMPSDEDNVTKLQEYRTRVDSSYAAMYHPWIQVFDPLEKKPAFMPPSGAMAGIYARTDNTRGVHKAPANEDIRGCTGLQILFGKPEQDMLSPVGINLIRDIQDQGITVWGARTCSSDPSWKYINVRRLCIYIEESIRHSSCWAVFEPNDALLWTKVSGSITAFLRTLWRDGALMGASEGEAFFVDIGQGSTMTDDDILNGRLVCVIGVAPMRPAEFVIFRITRIMATNDLLSGTRS